MTAQRIAIVGGGHNALVAAAYLARAGREVTVLERLDHVGGAAVSERAFAGVDASLSRYSYLVSLLPQLIVDELSLDVELRARTIGSYTPIGDGGILIDDRDRAGTDADLGVDAAAWRAPRQGSLAGRGLPAGLIPNLWVPWFHMKSNHAA